MVQPDVPLEVLRKAAELAGRAPESIRPETRLNDVAATLPEMLFLVSEVQAAFGVQLPWGELTRVDTLGELANLIVKARTR